MTSNAHDRGSGRPGRPGREPAVIHGLSFDVECYYQIVAKDYLGARVAPTPEVERNTAYLLDALAENGVKATFFTLANVAEHYPGVIRRIADEGHELAVHGYDHLYITEMDRAGFRDELVRAVTKLEDVAGVAIEGHRAPAFSVVRDTLWACDVMREAGLCYDSSIYPIAGKRYGIADAPRTAWRLENGLAEVPLTAVSWRGRTLPAAGGGYARLFPYRYTRWALEACRREGRPAITYFHPHEFEPARPKMPGEAREATPDARRRLAKFNFVQGTGRGLAMRRKLERLLTEFRFRPLREIAAGVA